MLFLINHYKEKQLIELPTVFKPYSLIKACCFELHHYFYSINRLSTDATATDPKKFHLVSFYI